MNALGRHGNTGLTKRMARGQFRLAPLARAMALVLAAGGAAGTAQAAPAAFSSGWFSAMGSTQSHARANGVAPSSLFPTGAQQNQQAQQKLAQSLNNLGRVAAGIAAQQAMQNAMRVKAMSLPSDVPDGLAAGGLSVDNNNAWVNAQLDPQHAQTVDATTGHVTVTVNQSAPRAIANWSSFNVGKNTTLHFDQSAGTQSNGANNWAILNRINEPGTKPSEILGQITAEGSVYVINRNGIIFGGSSQVNTHALVASSLDLLNTNDHLVQTSDDVKASNDLFLSSVGGLAALEAGQAGLSAGSNNVPNEVLGLGNHVSVASAGDYQAPGDIVIAPGASITTHANGAVSDGGFILIAATNVSNAGSITATNGQAILAAGVGVSLRPSVNNPQLLVAELSGKVTTGPDNNPTDITPAGTLTNTGIIQSAHGSVNLLGSTVMQNAVAAATTSISTPGGITISTVDEYVANTPTGTAYPGQTLLNGNLATGADITSRAGQLIFGDGSITTVLPDQQNGGAATSSPGSTFTPGSITMTAGSVWFQNGSLIDAPGATVTVAALDPAATLVHAPPGDTAVPGRVYLDSGATIDVAGLADVQAAVADTLVTIGRVGQNELADSPLLRNSFLFGLTNVVIDSTLSGTRADGTQWVGSPLLNAQGYMDQISRPIGQLQINGGTITLAGAQVMTATGSALNLDGGFIHYAGGMVDTTVVRDQYGRIVPIGQADPNTVIVGMAGEYTSNHARWGVTQTYRNPLIGRPVYEDDFIVGGNAGTLNVFGSQAVVLDGGISAQAVAGTKQIHDNSQPVGGAFTLGSVVAARLVQGADTGTSGESGLVIFQGSAPQLSDLAAGLSTGFSADTLLDKDALKALSDTDPNNVLATTVIPVDTFNAAGFANVSVTEDKTQGKGFLVTEGTRLAVQAGGSIALNNRSGSDNVLGVLIAPGGLISIASGGDIVVGPNGMLSVAGQWVNNFGVNNFGVNNTNPMLPGSSAFINGGSITLSTRDVNNNDHDGTGSILLQPGSVIDVSGGGEMQADGRLLVSSNGVAQGRGGSLSLLTYFTPGNQLLFGDTGVGADSLPKDQPLAARIRMDGTIKSAGFAGGGTLTLQAPGFQIGGDPAQAPAGDMVLPADFFAQQGFGNYVLNALYDTTVAAGATVRLTQQNLIPDVLALQQAATGTDLAAGGLTSLGTLDPYYRQATSLVLTAGGYAEWRTSPSSVGIAGVIPAYAGVTGGVTVAQGASIVGDVGAHIGLGSPAQITVLGSLIAPGGAIVLSADAEPGGIYEQSGQYAGSGGLTSASKSVWLGSGAVLDVAGVALTDPFPALVKSGSRVFFPSTGKVLPGGTVTISDDSGYVVAQAGSVIDVSGASARFDVPQANGGVAAQAVWSDAGTITLAASSGLYFDGTLKGRAGAPQAQGGTLAILPVGIPVSNELEAGGSFTPLPGATALLLQQSGDSVPAGLTPGQDFTTALNGVLRFSVDRLDGSGISALVLGTAGAAGGAAHQNAAPVVFSGDVDLNLARAVVINTGQIVALSGQQVQTLLDTAAPPLPNNGSSVPSVLATLLSNEAAAPGPLATGTSVTIDAPYVALAGPTLGVSPRITALAPVAALADSTLTVNASFIDLENQVQLNNFGQANFTSRGDIRLSSSNANDVPDSPRPLLAGELYTPGNLTFTAADLYPSTASTFILDAVGPTDPATHLQAPTTITFQSNGPSTVPLSAGGTLLVNATDIVQGGTVRAPSGSLVFGVGDPADTATQAQFNTLPLTATNSVTLTNGSVTSVSNDGAIIPYGTTVDGVQWQFRPVSGTATPDLTAPPAKFISVNGSKVALNAGASIDLSGGGDLQAAEWVPGTGGTRDVLSQYNVSFATTPSGIAVPTNVGAANIYAILPGAQSPVAAFDPVFAQTVQPSVNINGSASTQTVSMGVGQAALNGAVGESVYLSGVAGLPTGYYTLLPAKYATVPGAYRVTVQSSGGTVVPGTHVTAPDGTQVVAGYFGNALDGSRSATPTLFDVQSGAVWKQYSQYTLSSANSFFQNLAARAGHVTPPLPMDGGQLVLAATQSLSLGAALNTAAAAGGAPAVVDIASRDIQIVGNGETALAGYLQISASQLDQLGAGSLLIGGTRTQTANGISIDAIANSVVVSNDAANPLTGPEVILVTKTGASDSDPNAANGLRIDTGSVIEAQGSYPAARDLPISIGQADGASGDGALLMVSNGGAAVVTRANTTAAASNAGLLTVAAGAVLNGGQVLTLDSSGNLTFDPGAALSGDTIAVDGSAITFTDKSGAAATGLPGFVVGAMQIAQLAHARQVILRSSGAMNFDGDVDVTFGNQVDLSAGTFVSNGGAATINAPQIAFTNEINAAVSPIAAGSGTLTVNAGEIDFGTGNKTVSGFGSIAMNATGGIVGQGTGTFDAGTLPLSLSAPVYLADTGSASTLKTTGALTLNNASGTVSTRASVGGAINFIGGTIDDNGAIFRAPAGNVSMEATSGDLTIGNGAVISSAGVAKQFFDITVYAPAGTITLTSDTGTVDVQAGSTLDFSGANGGGAAGSVSLSAPQRVVNLNGTIKGNAADGFAGGSFSLTTGGAVDLDNLAAELASSGVNAAIAVDSKSGNLVLSAGNTIKAHVVSLTADGGAGGQDTANGRVNILGTIDASGNAGGEIDLYGKSGVDVEGKLVATGSSATQRGGTVNIGTTAINTPNVNATYGYEDIAASNAGTITLGGSATIDVSGGTAGGLSGGTVNLRLPVVNDGSGGVTVNLAIAPRTDGAGPLISGARSVALEAYGIWSTTDNSTGDHHFDGVVDPAGWYGNTVAGAGVGQPGMVAGTWTDQSGATLAAPTTPDQLASYLANDIFTPATANADHQGFYGYKNGDVNQGPGALMNFVEHGVQDVANKFANTGIANFAVVPGIELDNPDATINNGNISILSNWNLGSGASQHALDFRFNGQAPVITFRAENNVEVKASLTDGFFQISNPTGNVATITVPTGSDYDTTYAEFNSTLLGGGAPFSYYADANGYNYGITAPENFTVTDANAQQVAQYEGQYNAYFQFLASATPINGGNLSAFQAAAGFSHSAPVAGQPTLSVALPTAAEAALDATLYLRYLANYSAVFNALITALINTGTTGNLPVLQPPPAALGPLITTSTISNGTVATDNSPSPVAAVGNALPLLSASLAGGTSTSFLVVSGADHASANPLAVQAAALFQTGGRGNVTLDGHTAFVDANNRSLLAPTMIRTGTGTIDIAAANDIALLDTATPGVIYTAGAPSMNAPAGNAASILTGSSSLNTPDILVSPAVNPEGAGDISIHAQGNITGIENVTDDAAGSVTGLPNKNITQFWTQWLQTGNTTNSAGQITQTSINFGAFDQGVMSVGGNVSVSAGGNIADLAVSLPTTWYLTSPTAFKTVGGGNLTVTAGGDILSGDYFVAKGTGAITASGRIASDVTMPSSLIGAAATPIATLLATQDGVLNVSARQGVDIGGVMDPSPLQSYSPASAMTVESTTGDVQYVTSGDQIFGFPLTKSLPATVNFVAFTGGITVTANTGATLAPSPVGNLSLIADQSIGISGAVSLAMVDDDPSSLPSPTNPQAQSDPNAHALNALHAGDTVPARIYSLNGSIVDGVLDPAGTQDGGPYDHGLTLNIDKPALIQAGQDIVNLAFQGQNLRGADVTRIVAGRDIVDFPVAGIGPATPSLQLGGPGTFDIEAGRNIGPLTGANGTGLTGINAVGNALNPNLPHESADINVLFGIGPGVDSASFIAAYIDPSVGVAGIPSSTPALIAFMQQYDASQGIDTGLAADKAAAQAAVGTLSADQAWSQFQALPAYVQQSFAEKVLFNVLTDVGHDFHDTSSPFFQQYSRGYQAINTLFPAALGYTANNLEGGANGANRLVSTGNLDIRSTTIQTQQGGNVTILGPGGQALVGSTSAPPVSVDSSGKVIAGPGTMGILTLEQGDIDIFTDTSVLLAQSRIFTEQGGSMTIWSSNGDINAGKGSKSSADIPPPNYVCDANHYCTVDARGEVTGAGIATLQTIPGAPPGDVNLLAPRGTVDAGDAGIRVSGDINIAALAVANADNIQVQGKSTGIPVIAQVNVAALTSASAAASAAADAAADVTRQQQAAARQALPSIITVQVLGFGNEPVSGGVPPAPPAPARGPQSSNTSYDQRSRVQLIGNGQEFDELQLARLTDEERRRLRP